MSKTFITVTNSAVITTPTVGAICGSVIFQNTCDSVAPSTLAASISSVGTALIAAERITIAKPTCTQISTTINHMLLNGGSCTNNTGLALVRPRTATAIHFDVDELLTSPSQTQSALSTPVWFWDTSRAWYMKRQMMPAPMNEIAIGKKISDLAAFSPLERSASTATPSPIA